MKKIIIAEDTERIRKKLVELIGTLYDGIQIDSVVDGKDLVDKVKENDYCVVLTDNRMVGWSGIRATEEIRKFNEKVPIYLMSSDTVSDSIIKKIGATGFIYKEDMLSEIPSILNPYLK